MQRKICELTGSWKGGRGEGRGGGEPGYIYNRQKLMYICNYKEDTYIIIC